MLTVHNKLVIIIIVIIIVIIVIVVVIIVVVIIIVYRYVDYQVTDILQMIGRANRPLIDDNSMLQ